MENEKFLDMRKTCRNLLEGKVINFVTVTEETHPVLIEY